MTAVLCTGLSCGTGLREARHLGRSIAHRWTVGRRDLASEPYASGCPVCAPEVNLLRHARSLTLGQTGTVRGP